MKQIIDLAVYTNLFTEDERTTGSFYFIPFDIKEWANNNHFARRSLETNERFAKASVVVIQNLVENDDSNALLETLRSSGKLVINVCDCGNKTAYEEIKKAIKDDAEARIACFALGETGNKEAQKALQEFLNGIVRALRPYPASLDTKISLYKKFGFSLSLIAIFALISAFSNNWENSSFSFIAVWASAIASGNAFDALLAISKAKEYGVKRSRILPIAYIFIFAIICVLFLLNT